MKFKVWQILKSLSQIKWFRAEVWWNVWFPRKPNNLKERTSGHKRWAWGRETESPYPWLFLRKGTCMHFMAHGRDWKQQTKAYKILQQTILPKKLQTWSCKADFISLETLLKHLQFPQGTREQPRRRLHPCPTTPTATKETAGEGEGETLGNIPELRDSPQTS